MIAKWKALIETLKEQVFKRYPVTMVLVALGALLLGIVFDSDYEKVKWIGRITLTVWTTAAGMLFLEELFRTNKKGKLFGTVGALAIAILFTALMSYEGKIVFGMDAEVVCEEATRVYLVYLVWLIAISVFHMFQKSGHDFPQYCLRVAGGYAKTTIVYGIFAIGIAVIVFIFNVLLFDTDSFLGRLEVVLVSSVYLAGVLLAVSDTAADVSKFFKVVVKFVLMPLTMAAFVIIYLYIIKLLVTQGLPSNEVFAILTALFCAGLPIWTVATSFAEEAMGKCARILPYAFLPFIVLQIICVGMRIGQYGLTESRYMGCFLIVFELIYIVLYAVFRAKYLPDIVFVLVAMMTLFVLVPGVRADDAVYLSQKARLQHYLDLPQSERETLSAKEIKKMTGAFDALKGSRKGKQFVDAIPLADFAWIQDCGDKTDHNIVRDEMYINAYYDRELIEIGGYAYMCEFYANQDTDVDVHAFPVTIADEIKTEIDISTLVSGAVSAYEADEYGDMGEWLKNHNTIDLPNGDRVIVTSLHMRVQDDVYDNVDMQGYYLSKQ